MLFFAQNTLNLNQARLDDYEIQLWALVVL